MTDWDALYRDATASPPWEIGGPQPALARLLDHETYGPRVLDLGCGTGELALALARRGHDVTGIDISPTAIEAAREKAASAGLTVRFEVRDATALTLPDAPFDAVFDSGLLHNLARYGGLAEYVALLPGLVAPGGSMIVLAIAEAAGEGWGVTEQLLRAGFAEPEWTGTRIETTEVEALELRLAAFLVSTRRAADR